MVTLLRHMLQMLKRFHANLEYQIMHNNAPVANRPKFSFVFAKELPALLERLGLVRISRRK